MGWLTYEVTRYMIAIYLREFWQLSLDKFLTILTIIVVHVIMKAVLLKSCKTNNRYVLMLINFDYGFSMLTEKLLSICGPSV